MSKNTESAKEYGAAEEAATRLSNQPADDTSSLTVSLPLPLSFAHSLQTLPMVVASAVTSTPTATAALLTPTAASGARPSVSPWGATAPPPR